MNQQNWPATKIEMRPIDALINYARNSRKHSDAQIDKVAASIREFGWTIPILIDEDNTIIAGHCRVLSAKKLNITEVPVMVAKGWSEAQRRAYVISDNQLTLLGEWNEEILKLELLDLKAKDFDLGLTGFDSKELDLLLKDDVHEVSEEVEVSPAQECQQKWNVQVGDVFHCGNHRIVCGDSTNSEVIKLLMQDAQANMVLTDPPYGMHLDTDWSDVKGSLKIAGAKSNTFGKKYDRVIGDHDDFNPALIHTIFQHFNDCREIFLFGADYYADLLPKRNEGSWLVWDKRKESQSEAIGAEFELCWSKNKHKRRMLRHDWFGFLSSSNPTEARERMHPTQKPTSLLIDIMQQWGKKFDTVVDLYLGSGSLLLACENSERICYGCELDPQYVAVALERWSQLTNQEPIKA